MPSAKLSELARLYSVQLHYTDAAGTRQIASQESLLTILDHRTGGATVEEAIAARKADWWERGADPVTVVWGDAPLRIELRLPQNVSGSLQWELALEDGSQRAGSLDLCDPEWVHERFAARYVTIPISIPNGYHTLRLTAGERTYETFVIAAPEKAFAPDEKTWGLFLPLYAAHSRRSWGAGDVTDLIAYREWIGEYGGGVVATLPMLAAFDDEPSPYAPVSRLYWNELYLDPTRLPEFDPTDVDEAALTKIRATRDVDHRAVRQAKRRVLERMAARFVPDEDFTRFAGEADEYAMFRARREGREDAVRYHLYVQYRLAQQMRGLAEATRRGGLGLYLDFPLGVHASGYDAWRYSDHFAKGVSVGAPPDLFFTKGQNWGFPPLDPDAMREHRYSYFRAAIAQHVSHAGILRLDHVMGLHRLFWIPQGGAPKDGVYVRYPEEELYAILMLESQRHRCVIVGEDLGTVPEYVPRMMAKHGIRRMFVVQYDPYGTPPAQSVASINTHDMPSFAGYWEGRDIDDRVEQKLLDAKGARTEQADRAKIREYLKKCLAERGLLNGARPIDVLQALLAYLSESDAEIVLVNLEDLWLEPEPQNVPGQPQRSWRRRFALGLEQTQHDADVRRLLSTVSAARSLLPSARQR